MEIQAWLTPLDGQAAFQKAKILAKIWIAEQFSIEIPESSKPIALGICKTAATSASFITIPAPQTWSVRLDHVDAAKTQWALELTLAVSPNRRCCFRMSLGARDATGRVATPAHAPALVGALASAFGLFSPGPQPFSPTASVATTPIQVDRLIESILSPRRMAPIVVLACEAEGDEAHSAIGDRSRLDALAARLCGVANVVALPEPQSYELSRAFGKTLSTFQGAIRVYMPGFSTQDDPFIHQLFLPARIATWEGGMTAFLDYLSRAVAASASDSFSAAPLAPSHATMSLLLQRTRLIHPTKETEAPKRPKFVEPIRGTPARAAPVTAQKPREPKAPTPKKESLATLREWSEKNLDGKVAISERALRAARKAESDRVVEVHAALLLLKESYAPMRIEGGAERRKAFEDACVQGGFRCSQVTRTAIGSALGTRDYVAQIDGRDVPMTHKLNQGTSRDERRQVWVYFGWDAETSRVVIGWLPTHLRSWDT